MFRPFLYEIVLFLLPFAAYAVYLLVVRRRAGEPEWGNAPLVRLFAASLICVAIGLALFAHFGGAPAGKPYVPAHMENGVLVQPETR